MALQRRLGWMTQLWNRLTEEATFRLEPSGTRVLIRDWAAGDDDWVEVGETPLLNVRVPKGDLRWKFEHPGWITLETVNVASAHRWMAGRSTLPRASTVPPGMAFLVG